MKPKKHNSKYSNPHISLLPPLDPQDKLSIKLRPLVNAGSPKSIPQKMKILNEIGFGEINSLTPLAKSRIPVICIADFIGEKEKFLRRAGYWEAFLRLQETEKISTVRAKSNLSKPDNPHNMDINTERKVLFEQQRRELRISPLLKPPSGRIQKSSTSDLEEIKTTLEGKQTEVGRLGKPHLVKICKSTGNLGNFN